MEDNTQYKTEGTGEVSPTSLSSPVSETISYVDKAAQIADRMEAANKKSEELLARQEAIAARLMLSGRTEAGQVNKSPEEISKEEVAKQTQEIVKRFRR